MDAISEFRSEIEEGVRENSAGQEQTISSDQRVKTLSPTVFVAPVLRSPESLSFATEKHLSTVRRNFLLNKASVQQAESRSGMSMAFQAIHIKLESSFEKSGRSIPVMFQALFENVSPAQRMLLKRVVCSLYPVMGRDEQKSLPQTAAMMDLYKISLNYHKWIQRQLVSQQGVWVFKSPAVDNAEVEESESASISENKEEKQGVSACSTKEDVGHSGTRSFGAGTVGYDTESNKKLSILLEKSESEAKRYQTLSRQFLEGQQQLERRVEQLQTTIQGYEKQQKTDEAMIQQLKKEQEGVELINQELETSLSAVSKENARLAEENHHVKQQFSEISEALDISRAKEVSLRQKTEQAERDFQQLARQASESSVRQEQAAQEVERLEQTVCEYQERISGLADMARQLLMSVESMAEIPSENDVSSHDEIDYIYTVQKKLSRHISELEGNLLKVSEQAQESRVQARDYQQKLSGLEQEKACSDDIFKRDIRVLEQQLAESSHQYAQQQEQQKNQVDRLMSSKSAIEQQCRTLKRVIDDRLSYIGRLEKNINILSNELTAVRVKNYEGFYEKK